MTNLHSPGQIVVSPDVLAHRREYALLLRQFISGRMTNFDYDDRCDELEDRFNFGPAVWAVYAAVWHLYDDNRRHRMTDRRHRPDRRTRRRVAEFVLFLRSGKDISAAVPVEEPEVSGWCLIKLALGLLATLALIVAFGPSVALLLVAVLGVLLLALARSLWILATGWGITLAGRALVLAAWEPSPGDPWPFASPEDRLRAIATPTYLYGRT